MTFDLYIPGTSWLHRLDPRIKLLGMTVGGIAAFTLSNIPLQFLYLLSILLLLSGARVPWRALYWLWQQCVVLVIFILVLQPFFSPTGRVLLAIGPIQLTVGGLSYSALLALRTLSIAFVVGGLLFTTDQRALVRAFVRLGLPYTWGLTISLTLRFLPTIQHLFVAIREAQAARGWVAEGNFFRRIRDYVPVLVAVVIGTLRMSDHLTLALAARGVSRGGARTTWHDLQMCRADWIVLGILGIILVALLTFHLSRFVLY
ncbi:MAG: energy-coupling factor transporter transmembrane protein EcfT [Anaerolineae bacterium]|nr:energy-coupling factor transporter transmembrane protein EcfT [Anaerolineae bacterium]